jgi:hypothetical protein
MRVLVERKTGPQEIFVKLQAVFRKRTTYEFLFSLYLSALVMSVEEMGYFPWRDFSWTTLIRLRIFSYFHPQAPKPIDAPHEERLIAFLLAWLLVILIFFSLRLFARFSFMRVPLNIVAGLVALGGLPAVLWYICYENRVLLTVQIVVSAFCVLLYAYRRWPAPWRMSLALLVLYFGSSTWVAWRPCGTFRAFPLVFFALWPGFDWVLGTYPRMQNIFPLLGFVFSVVWGIHVRETADTTQSLEVPQ